MTNQETWQLNLLKESMHDVKKIWHIIPSHTQTQNQIIVQDPNIKQRDIARTSKYNCNSSLHIDMMNYRVHIDGSTAV